MKIVILDKASLGDDTPFERLYDLFEVDSYDSTIIEEIKGRISDADVIITNKVKITEEVMSCSDKLKLVCVFATGYDNVDVKAAARRNIGVCNVPGYSTESVTLFTVSTISWIAPTLKTASTSGNCSRISSP